MNPKGQELIENKINDLETLIIKQITRPDGILLIANILMQ